MNTKLLIMSVLFCCCGYDVFASIGGIETQQVDQTKIVVKGVVKTTKGQTLPFSTVKITSLNSDGEHNYSQVADNEGVFNISVITASKYKIEAKFMGMKTKVIEVGLDKIKAGIITIELEEDDKSLEQVVVTQKRKLIKVELDKLSYDIANDPTSSSSSVLEMLRKVPLVTVSGDDNIQVNGSSQFQIFINGKPTKALGEKPQEALKAMPAVSVKNIEVITEPGVKYGIDGGGAILNIITETKSSFEGYYGTLSSLISVNDYGFTNNNNLYLNLSKKDWGINVNLTNYNSYSKNQKTKTEEYQSPEIMYNSELSLRTKFYNPINVRSSFYYNITPKDLINASINVSLRKIKGYVQAISNNPNVKKNYTDAKDSRISPNISLDYQHSFDREGAFFTMSYLFDSFNGNSFNRIYDNNENTILLQDPTKKKYRENTLQMDFVLPFDKIHKVETGLKYINRYNYSFSNYKTDIHKNREYKYIYNISAMYADYKLNIKNVSFRAGLRGELTYINLTDYGKKVDLKPRFDWIPNVSLGYNINQMTNIKLNYNFRVVRPTIWQLSPDEENQSFNLSYIGNPNLKSAKIHNLSFTFSHFSPVMSLRFGSGFSMLKDNIEQKVSSIITPSGYVNNKFTYINIDGGHSFNFNLYLAYNKIQWLRPSLYLSYNLDKNTYLSKYMSYYSGNFNADFILPKESFISLVMGAAKQKLNNDIIMAVNPYVSLGITKELLNKHLSLSLSGVYMPKTLKIENINKMKYPYSIFYVPMQRYVEFSITYRFGKNSNNQKKVNKSIVNDDKATGGGGIGF